MQEAEIETGASELVALIHTNMPFPDLALQLNRMAAERGAPVTVEELAAAGGWSVQESKPSWTASFGKAWSGTSAVGWWDSG